MNIGYIGLGALGGQLARRFLQDHRLTVWDINESAVRELSGLGAEVAPTAAELAKRCDVVLLCLPRSSDVRNVIFSPNGLCAGLSPGKIVVDQTSGVPDETREMASALAESGVFMMDAAVSASPQIVPTGKATLMVSAADEILGRAEGALRAITENIYRCGSRVGDGQAMKTVNNAMNAGCRLGTLEVLAFGRKAGVKLEQMASFLNEGEARSQITERMLPALLQGKASTNFALALMLKDVYQALSLGVKHGTPMPLTSIVHGLLQIGGNIRGPGARLEDMVAVIGLMAATDIVGQDDTDAAPLDQGSLRVDMSSLLSSVVASQCRTISYECIAAGLNYGLSIERMAEVLDSTSGWSAALRMIFRELVDGERPSKTFIDEALNNLQVACMEGSRKGAPLSLANETRSIFQQMRNQFGDAQHIDELSRLYSATSKLSSAPVRSSV